LDVCVKLTAHEKKAATASSAIDPGFTDLWEILLSSHDPVTCTFGAARFTTLVADSLTNYFSAPSDQRYDKIKPARIVSLA
jgi:hypothetical protein